MAKNETNHPLNDLKFLIGAWKTEGEMLDEDGKRSITIAGTDTYAWALDDQFILHTVDVMMGDERIEAMELMGYDKSNKIYQLHSFDNKGAYALMKGKFDHGKFIIHGDSIRATLQYDEERNEMNAAWERTEHDNIWIPWMHIKFSV